MDEAGFVSALAGLLCDPMCSAEIEQIVPALWRESVRKAVQSPNVQRAARLAASLRGDEVRLSKRDTRLRSIFYSIVSEKNQRAPQPMYWSPAELKLDDATIFPTLEAKSGDAIGKLFKNFLDKAAALRKVYEDADEKSGSVFIENLMLLMQGYLWSVPCAYASLPDVSLYDHSRMTAALASLESQDMLLVGGDISGVQDFIYTISADGAASALRGRSFYLQLLNEIFPRLILDKLDLPLTNLIYSGGGNFYLLVHASDQQKLDALRERISRILWAHQRGELYLALASLPLKEADFFEGEISKRWNDLGGLLQRAKQRRFSELGNDLIEMFKPEGRGGSDQTQCRVCGLEHSGTHERPDDKPRICPPCEEFEELGKKLRKADYLFVHKTGEVKIPPLVHSVRGTWQEVLKDFGFEADVFEHLPTVTGATLFALKDDAVKELQPRKDLAVGRRYFVNVTPSITQREIEQLEEKRKPQDQQKEKLDTRNVKPFDVLQEQAHGVKRLGVLRMDVDNLGKLFAGGIEKPCLARVASLSFAVSLYFEGWVEHLAEQRNKADGKDRLYSIYSGGDDLFFVGSWDAVIELAREIRRDLSRYAAYHPGIHASAGMVLIGGKYPLYQAARDAGEAEAQAKAYRNEKGETKNAITFLSQTVPWDLFGTDECKYESIENVHALMHQLVTMLAEEKDKPPKPRALLGILIDMQEKFAKAAYDRLLQGRAKNKNGQPQILFGQWQWLGFYALKRMHRRELNRNPNFAEKVYELNEQLKANQFSNIEWIGLSARWAELLVREKT